MNPPRYENATSLCAYLASEIFFPSISEAPTLSFAKNLFPFNGSSLFTSAN